MTQSRPRVGLHAVPQIMGVVMLLWALVPTNPYGYYVLLRIVLCAICAYLAVKACQLGRIPWAWILVVTGVIYNPFFRVHLTREIWSVVNVLTVVMLCASVAALHRSAPQDH